MGPNEGDCNFSGPATGLWICAPFMSLISTAVVGRGSSTELAALGPGTVFCDKLVHVPFDSNFQHGCYFTRKKGQKGGAASNICYVFCWLFMWSIDTFVNKISRFMGINCFYWPKECAYCICSKQICSDSWLGMACCSLRTGCSKCKVCFFSCVTY